MDSVPASRATAVQPARPQSPPSPRPQTGPWSVRGLVAAWRGVALTGLILAEAGMLVALALAVTFAGLGFGLLLIPGLALAGRGLADKTRQLSGAWCGVPIDRPYLPPPWDEGGGR
jgi:hypothetical protein